MDIVLVHPEIPQNTGSIARTCAATRTPLHLIEPLGFELTEKRVRRAGLDYWPYVELHQHGSWQDYLLQRTGEHHTAGKIWALTKFADRSYVNAAFQATDALVFGSETKGLGQDFLSNIPAEQQLKIPMSCTEVRSLNLSNAVSIVLFEALRQLEQL